MYGTKLKTVFTREDDGQCSRAFTTSQVFDYQQGATDKYLGCGLALFSDSYFGTASVWEQDLVQYASKSLRHLENILSSSRLSAPQIFITYSMKNLRRGKAGYEANLEEL